MAGGAFQALVLVLLLVVVVVVAVVAVVLLRRPRTPSVAPPHAGRLQRSPAPDEQPADRDAATEPTTEQEAERATELLASVTQARAAFEEQMHARREELRAQRSDVQRREHRLTEREERLDVELRSLNEQLGTVDATKAELEERRTRLDDAETERLHALERVAGMTAEQAKAELVAGVEHDAKRQAVIVAREIERKALREADERARNIVVGAIQRVASDQTSE